MKKLFLLIIFAISIITQTNAQPTQLQRLALIPFQNVGVEPKIVISANALLRGEISRPGTLELLTDENAESCIQISCAIEYGENVDADLVATGQLLAMGSKTIVHFFLVDINLKEQLFSESLTISHVEDLETVIKRVAESIVENIPVEKAETEPVENVVEEKIDEPQKRRLDQFVLFSLGYLYPQNGYNEQDRIFTGDVRIGGEINNVAVGLQVGVRQGVAANVYTQYLMSKKDVCPYVGGGLGFHWVSHPDYYEPYWDEWGRFHEEEKRGDGFELVLDAGFRFLRTFNIQLNFDIAYSISFNDFDDQALIFTIGFLP